MESNDDGIEVVCKKITKNKKLICDITWENFVKMQKDGPPDHTHYNVKSKDFLQTPEENKSIDSSKDAEADSSNKEECGCTQTAENTKTDNPGTENQSQI